MAEMAEPTCSHGDEAAQALALMDARRNVYDLLTRCFEREVDASFAQFLAHEFSFESSDEQLCAAMEGMRLSLAGADEDALEQLAVVFDRVFFGMGPRTAQKAFPYESVYTSERGIMMQEAYSQAVSLYRTLDLHKDEHFTEPEDHLAVECAFMATLAQRTCDQLAQADEAQARACLSTQRDFLTTHLLTWLPRFCADLKGGAEDGFYYHLADFTERFAAIDAELLDDLLADDPLAQG